MHSNTKDKPRSCGCFSCKQARKTGDLAKKEERAFRHKVNQSVRTEVGLIENVTPAFSGKRNG